MKFLIPLLSLGLSSLASATFFDSQTVLTGDNDLAVPGDNPLQYCLPNQSGRLSIEYVNLAPNPPKAGQQLTITAAGNFTEQIDVGAYVRLTVKYGYIILIRTTQDLCEQMANVDEKCPLKEGKMTIVKEVELPVEVPPGQYTITADVYTVDDAPITCLTANVKFGGK